MSGPPTNIPFTIINAQSGLALNLSNEDDESIVASAPLSADSRQSWVVLPSESGDGTFSIQSLFNEQPVGFLGSLTQGAKVVVGDSSVAKDWGFQQTGPVDYMISVPGSAFVIGTPNPVAGAPVQMLGQTGEPNQIWLFQEIFLPNNR